VFKPWVLLHSLCFHQHSLWLFGGFSLRERERESVCVFVHATTSSSASVSVNREWREFRLNSGCGKCWHWTWQYWCLELIDHAIDQRSWWNTNAFTITAYINYTTLLLLTEACISSLHTHTHTHAFSCLSACCDGETGECLILTGWVFFLWTW